MTQSGKHYMSQGKPTPNRVLAETLLKVRDLHNGSWDDTIGQKVSPITGEPRAYGTFTKSVRECIKEVVGDDPIRLIIECLLTSGYAEMWEFCDQVLGPEAADRTPSSEAEASNKSE